MNLRQISKPIAAIVLSIGLVSLGVAAPADAATKPPNTTQDTGWGFR